MKHTKPDEDPQLDQPRLKTRKTSKDAEPSKGYKSKESKSISSKGTKSQLKSSGKSTQAEELVFETTSNLDQQNCSSKKPPISFDELMSTPIDFSAYVMHNLKIDNLTQDLLVGPTFNLLKGTCKSHVELEYNFEEFYKAITDRLDWNNPERSLEDTTDPKKAQEFIHYGKANT
ncbi:hypothetical protein Tco_1220348 [Tanacetum coccineum]